MAPRVKKEDMLIINRRTGKALQCAGAENGDVAVQAEVNGSDAQLWSPVGTGRTFKLRNKLSGKVLDVVGGGTEAGARAQIWDDVADGHSQVWQWLKVTATYRKLMNTQSGKVLDIVDMREDDGAPAQIWDDVDGAGQQWKLVESSTAPAEEEAPQEEAPQEEAPQEEAPKKRPSRKAKALLRPPPRRRKPPKRKPRLPKSGPGARPRQPRQRRSPRPSGGAASPKSRHKQARIKQTAAVCGCLLFIPLPYSSPEVRRGWGGMSS